MGGGEQLGPSEWDALLRDARESHDLAQEELEALEEAHAATSAFDEFLAEFQTYAETVKQTKAEIGDHDFAELWEKVATDPSSVTTEDLTGGVGAKQMVEQAHNLLEASIKNFTTAHKKLADALTGIAKGLDKTGKQVSHVTDKLEKLKGWYDRITNLPKMSGELTDEELIEAFTGYFSLLTDVLGGLTKLFPPLKAMLSWYGDVIAGLEQPLKAIAAGKARTNAAIDSWLSDATKATEKAKSEAELALEAAQRRVNQTGESVEHLERQSELAHLATRHGLATAVEERVLEQQLRQTGRRADKVQEYVDETMLEATNSGDPRAIERAKRTEAEAHEIRQDYRNRLADHVADSPHIDTTTRETLFETNPWLEEMVEEREARKSSSTAAPASATDGATGATDPATDQARGSRRTKLIVAAAAGLALLAVPVVFSLGSDGDTPAGAETAPNSVGEAPPSPALETRQVVLGDDLSVDVTYAPSVQAGSDLTVKVCGDPGPGNQLYATLGNDPGGDASHANGVPGADGCLDTELEARDGPGTTTLWVAADGHDAAMVDDQIEVTAAG